MKFSVGCYCKMVRYEIDLEDTDKARTSICHCKNYKVRSWLLREFGNGWHDGIDRYGNSREGILVIHQKLPKNSFRFTNGKDGVKGHEADNGSSTLLHREFCGTCGNGLLEYGANAGDFIYISNGILEEPSDLPPKGEVFCKVRDPWMPEIQGLFKKREIME